MAEEILGRRLPDGELEQIAQRLSGLIERVRSIDSQRLQGLDPAITFPAGQVALAATLPRQAAWRELPATPGGSGYTVSADAEPIGQGSSGPSAGPPPSEWLYRSAVEIAEAVRQRQISPVELTRATLDRAEALQPLLNSYLTLTPDQAMTAARALEAAVARGDEVGPLAGVTLGIKDCFATAGIRTTGGSKHLADWRPEEDATVVARLRAAGAIAIGKTHTHEWFFGGTNNNEHYGPGRNPWDPARIPGGSSGGSAAAVAAGAACVALGSDTAGSVRIPAAACGVVGLKPTFGRVSRAGGLLLTWSFDTSGFLTRTVADAALLLGLLAGPDPRDPNTPPVPVADYASAVQDAKRGLRGIRIGVDRRWFEDHVEEPVRRSCAEALHVLAESGAEVREVELPSPHQLLAIHRLVALPESSTYHAAYLEHEPEKYSDDVRLRLQIGRFMLAGDYLTGQRLRSEICQTVAAAMSGIDVLATPTLPIRAPRIGAERIDLGGVTDVVSEALIRLTSPFNITGQPAISVPCGFPGGLPVSLQFVGRPFEEASILRVAAAYEAVTDGYRRRPPV